MTWTIPEWIAREHARNLRDLASEALAYELAMDEVPPINARHLEALAAEFERAVKPAGEVRDDVRCECVGQSGPNPDCGRCGGDGVVTARVKPTDINAELLTALEEIRDLEPKPFAFPGDWSEQIRSCPECKRYKEHPIQHGICDTHRKPLNDRDRHDSDAEKRIGWRAKGIARDALAKVRGETTDG